MLADTGAYENLVPNARNTIYRSYASVSAHSRLGTCEWYSASRRLLLAKASNKFTWRCEYSRTCSFQLKVSMRIFWPSNAKSKPQYSNVTREAHIQTCEMGISDLFSIQSLSRSFAGESFSIFLSISVHMRQNSQAREKEKKNSIDLDGERARVLGNRAYVSVSVIWRCVWFFFFHWPSQWTTRTRCIQFGKVQRFVGFYCIAFERIDVMR